MLSKIARFVTIVTVSLLASAAEASADQDGTAFFTQVREAYAERPAYADVGEIEIIREVEGYEASELHFFETAATKGAGLVWRVMLASDRGFEDRTVWLTGDSVSIYDGGLRQSKAAPSVAAAMREVLGSPGGEALLVPSLLAYGRPSEALDALLAEASLGEPEPCLDDRQCLRLRAPLRGKASIELLVDAESFWVHDVVLVASADGETTTVRVRHSESPLGDEAVETGVAFTPPPSTLEVADWDDGRDEEVEEPDETEAFFEVITVDIFTVPVRIVDDSGAPIPDLQPSDLVATVGKREFPVIAVDWQGPALETDDSTGAEAALERTEMESLPESELPTEEPIEGRTVVIFLQNDFEPTRVKGQMKLFPGLRRVVDNFGPHDRVAVLSYFAHLKLWQDFTTDREAVKASLERAFFPGATPGVVTPDGHPALLDTFDIERARAIANSVDALRYTAETLAAIPGEKDIIFFGYGLEGGSPEPMFRALQAAQATTFVIDTTQADAHTLGAGLMTMARATGGTYASSLHFAAQALREIERMISGRYLITIDRSEVPDALGRLRIRLREKKGRVMMTPRGFLE